MTHGQHNAIPTKYRGVQFRSRLEARWAAFFDLVGWPWRYEPLDLNGYIPDFIVEHELTRLPLAGGTRSVDWIVTPCTGRRRSPPMVQRLVEVKPEIDHVFLLQHGSKIDASGWTGHAAIVGAAPGFCDGREGFELGIFRYDDQERSPQYWGGPWVMSPRSTATAAWITAGNQVQWRGVDAEPEELAAKPTVDP
jgi:hypothetical protein